MTRLIELLSDRIVMRRADGRQVLDTSRPMPAHTGSSSYTGVTLEFTTPTQGEATNSGETATTLASSEELYTIDLGPSPAYDVNFIWANLRVHHAGVPSRRYTYQHYRSLLRSHEWLPFSGTMLAEMHYVYTTLFMVRTFDLAQRAGRFVVDIRQSNNSFSENFSTNDRSNFYSRYVADIDLAYGVYSSQS